MSEIIGCLDYRQMQFQRRLCWKEAEQDVAKDFKNFGKTKRLFSTTHNCSTQFPLKDRVLLILERELATSNNFTFYYSVLFSQLRIGYSYRSRLAQQDD